MSLVNVLTYLEVDVRHTEVNDNGCERQKYAVHLEPLLAGKRSTNKHHSVHSGFKAPRSIHPTQQRSLEVGWTIGWTRWSRGAPGKNQTGRNGLEEGASVASTQNVPKQDFCFQPTVVAPIQWCLDLSSLEFKSNFHSCSVAQANCTNISQRILPYCALNFNSLHWTFLEHCSDKSKYQKRYYQYFFFILFC